MVFISKEKMRRLKKDFKSFLKKTIIRYFEILHSL